MDELRSLPRFFLLFGEAEREAERDSEDLERERRRALLDDEEYRLRRVCLQFEA